MVEDHLVSAIRWAANAPKDEPLRLPDADVQAVEDALQAAVAGPPGPAVAARVADRLAPAVLSAIASGTPWEDALNAMLALLGAGAVLLDDERLCFVPAATRESDLAVAEAIIGRVLHATPAHGFFRFPGEVSHPSPPGSK